MYVSKDEVSCTMNAEKAMNVLRITNDNEVNIIQKLGKQTLKNKQATIVQIKPFCRSGRIKVLNNTDETHGNENKQKIRH